MKAPSYWRQHDLPKRRYSSNKLFSVTTHNTAITWSVDYTSWLLFSLLRLLSRATKIILYKTLIRPIVSYGAEALTLTKKEEQALLIFLKENILKNIWVPNMKTGNGKVGRNEN